MSKQELLLEQALANRQWAYATGIASQMPYPQNCFKLAWIKYKQDTELQEERNDHL